ncbi:hypothetical protein P8452_66433 [Trifolium repens]|nr:hypothetical protein P8452_66433 [Trifolium repens]
MIKSCLSGELQTNPFDLFETFFGQVWAALLAWIPLDLAHGVVVLLLRVKTSGIKLRIFFLHINNNNQRKAK